jgi:UDP-4-amino-4,6-dideoxy-N-acetyl-beta-L-altrosamine N-acetyltransferase
MDRLSIRAKLRPMIEEDLSMVMRWRMLPEITKYMNSDPVLTLEGQKKWFNIQKENPDNYLWIVEIEGIPSGVLTILDLDRRNKRCSSGLYIAVKEKRSLEFIMQLEWNLYDFVFDKLGINKYFAEIFSLNKGLIRIKQMCGSEIEGVLKQHIYKNDEYYDITVMGILRDKWNELKNTFHYDPIEIITE